MNPLYYAHEERWENLTNVLTPSGEVLLVRETPPWKMRERMAYHRNRVLQIQINANLASHHHLEQFDETLPPLPEKEKLPTIWSRLADTWEQFQVWICQNFHWPPDSYQPGDHHYTCLCGRKFAVPWADYDMLPKGTYYQTFEPHATERTMQAEVKGAHARIIGNEEAVEQSYPVVSADGRPDRTEMSAMSGTAVMLQS